MSYLEVPISSWAQFREKVDGSDYRSWAFRGQACAAWPVFSALSRYLRANKVDERAWSGQEERILRIFKRKAHLCLTHVPAEENSFQWLALMQHHGAPTRLLDLTWSPYVAAFFALEHATEPASVWGFSVPGISDLDEQTIRGGMTIRPREMGFWAPGSYEQFFLLGTTPFVVMGEPFIMNRRLIAQSGTFLVPGVLNEPIESILNDYPSPETTVVKFVLDTEKMRVDALCAMYNMNITNATLFPGLDGLARSMAFELEFHWAFDPHTMLPNPGFPDPHDLNFWDNHRKSAP